ncbi:MAG TPA: 2-oxoglutarate dehydrogenase complex dihydrolipoyllysine-residue succinyltransferase [Chloroflexota bacterium]|nr:2-oxoglutarate dehydrogenase complex dihydrolipoyllysine-residue succinyltransferase [Chloroflexota bacterium]
MPTEVRVPALGESVVEATVGAWLKKEGDPVQAGEPLVQLETEKVNVEVTAERAGRLEKIAKQAGETVAPGDVLGTISEDGAPVRASGVAKRIAAEKGVDLAQVHGSGPAGRVMAADLERAPAQAAPPTAAPAPAPPLQARPHPTAPPAGEGTRREERIRMSRRRQVIAQRLVEAQRTAAMLTTFNEVDMSAVVALRAKWRDAFKERHGVGLGFMSFFTRAVVGALKAFPNLNAEVQGDEVVLKRYYDIGIAVGVEEGLVVPVLRDADRKTFAEIEREIAALAERARANTLTIEDLRGGTFTITNGGVYGSLMSTPILNPPQVGILGMHKIEERPIARDGQVVIRPMMYVALSYDHRVVDGSEAVRFLVRVKELVEDPEQLLLEG